ncbi:IS3 family transposase [Pseudactinotalea sp. HY158]|uniref:IS3 family transposase n=1 Tax=Pseudactinotalea sp. HY158 TaxID=2654547 RepID=UPI00129CCCDF|nr:IS3 family transposase [Pseudactinotalea sp. HY158]QGH71104.1 IS3 family transposase [Pseudactinotalea sp. HY158]
MNENSQEDPAGAGPRAGGPKRRRFTPAQKLAHVQAYEQALADGDAGAYLRREGLHSASISEWRRLRDAGVLEGKEPGQAVGRPNREQAEIGRLRRQLEVTQNELDQTRTALEIMGKTHTALGADLQERAGRARAHEALMATHEELTGAGITTREAARLTGISRATAARHGKARPAPTPLDRADPVNRLSCAEREVVLEVLDSPEFVDSTPMQVYATLLERGVYLCSVSTMYRILREDDQVVDRRRQARHPARTVPELVATGPGQVYTWDITKLPGPAKGVYYDAYVMLDIYSRYIVGAIVHARESGPLAEEMMREVFGIHGIPHVVHADRGTSMTSKSVAVLLEDLQVVRSHSRPRVSNDNPYSESLFKTAKYSPTFPDRFGSLDDARAWMAEFTEWYNHEHHHSGIGLHTPADVHYGHADQIATDRQATLAAARAAHPQRFSTNHAPKILDLPTAAWINQPDDEHDQSTKEDSNPAYEQAA